MNSLKTRCLLAKAVLLSTLSLLAAAATAEAKRKVGDKPNVIIIYSDDHGYADLGIMGIDPNVQTPVMDKLASEGALFTDGYCTAPQCVPSRAGLMAGQYQNRIGIRGNGDGELPDELYTPAERFRDLGYRTGQVGKWHLGYGDSAPKGHGFDDYWNGSNRHVIRNFTLPNDNDGTGLRLAEDPVHPGESARRLSEEEKLNTPPLPNRCIIQGQAAEAFIDLNKDEPFFLYLAIFGPHVPVISEKDPYYKNFPPQDYPHLSDELDNVRRKGLGLIKAVDDAIGGVVAKLEEHGLRENTLIFFAGDNGANPKLWNSVAEMTKKWDGSDNVPLRGEKGSLWEGGIRVPMWAHWPGVIPQGQVINDPVISLDFMATTHHLIDGTVPAEFDGVDLLPRLTKRAKQVERKAPLFWDYETENAIREGDWKLRRSNRGGDFLFNLKNDPNEMVNLANAYPEKLSDLKEKLEGFRSTLPKAADLTSKKQNWGDLQYVTGAKAGRTVDPRYKPIPGKSEATAYPAPITTK